MVWDLAREMPSSRGRHSTGASTSSRRSLRVCGDFRLPSKTMRTLDVERLAEGDYSHIKPLLVELHMGEQVHYSDHPQLSRVDIERHLEDVPAVFRGENVIYAVRDEVGEIVGFCWIVLYRSEEHTSELQSHLNLVCRLLLEKKKNVDTHNNCVL